MSRNGRYLIYAVVIVAAGFWMNRPGRNGGYADKGRTEALNNVRQLGISLIDFQAKYGSFPSQETLDKLVAEKGIQPFPLVSSNDYFRQLVAAGLNTEKPGYCLHPSLPSHRPDEVISPLEKAFASGEVGFAYIAGLTAEDAPDTPFLVAPIIPGTHRFDMKAFKGKAIILRLDNSATAMQIREDNGLVQIAGGKTLFDPDAPWWHGKVPNIKYPAR